MQTLASCFRKLSCRESAGIAHRPLLQVQDGGLLAAERATPLTRKGRLLAPRRPGCVRVQRAPSYPTPITAHRKHQYVSDLFSVYGRPRRCRRRSPQVTRIKNVPGAYFAYSWHVFHKLHIVRIFCIFFAFFLFKLCISDSLQIG